jgi:cytochrome c oxidase subunit 2
MRQELSNPKFNYELACAEICGRGHFSMRYILVVDEPAEYKQWVESQTPWIKSNRDFILASIPDAMKGEVPEEQVTPSTEPAKTIAPAPADTTSGK